MPVHRPMVVGAKGDAIAGVIVVGFGPRDQVGSFDEDVRLTEFDPDATGGAAVVI